MKKPVLTILLVCGFALVGLILLAGLAVYISHRQTALLPAPPEHGTAFVIAADLSPESGGTNALAELKEAMRRRFERFGVRIFWEPISESRIRVVTSITNETDIAGIKKTMLRGGQLEFRLVHENSDEIIRNGDPIPPGYELLKHPEHLPNKQTRLEQVMVRKTPEDGLSGSIIKDSRVVRDNLGNPEIEFTLTPEGAKRFADVTRANIGRRLAIMLDGELHSAPVIQSAIETGSGEITGSFTPEEAHTLADLMQCPLPVPVTLVEAKGF
jgi:preprotein translocase subunit SecD